VEIWRSKDGAEVAVTAATWELNPKVTFDSLRDEFRRNPVKAWRNYGSIVSMKFEAAIKNTAAILANANVSREDPWDEVRDTYKSWFRGTPGCRYFMHFDLSKSKDATGVAISHRDPRTRKMVVDFMHRVVASAGKDIDYALLRERFIYPLKDRGFYLEVVSYDSFQSAETMQILREKGYHTEEVSADKKPDPYDTLIEFILTYALDYYPHRVFIEEMEELRNVGGRKYDHPRKTRRGTPGSKDVSDAVACSVWSAVNYELDNPLPVSGRLMVIPRAQPRYGDERTI
jgi:hypothetical protein